jgi:hypothetical protein
MAWRVPLEWLRLRQPWPRKCCPCRTGRLASAVGRAARPQGEPSAGSSNFVCVRATRYCAVVLRGPACKPEPRTRTGGFLSPSWMVSQFSDLSRALVFDRPRPLSFPHCRPSLPALSVLPGERLGRGGTLFQIKMANEDRSMVIGASTEWRGPLFRCLREARPRPCSGPRSICRKDCRERRIHLPRMQRRQERYWRNPQRRGI